MNRNKRRLEIIIIPLLLGMIAASTASASLVKMDIQINHINILEPAIWYNKTGTSRIDTSFSSYRQKANVSGEDYNWALHIYDHSGQEGIVVYRDWNIIRGREKLKTARTQLVFFGVNITSDPKDMGVVITEIEVSGEHHGQSCIAFFSFYFYKNSTLTASYEVGDTTSGYYVIERGHGDHIRLNGLDPHVAYILLSYKNDNLIRVTWKLDGNTVYRKNNFNIGSICTALERNHASYVSINTGLFDPSSKYDMFIDNVSLYVRTSKHTHRVREMFGDGIDDHLERTYAIQSGSNILTVDEPPNTMVGSFIEYAVSLPVLEVETNIDNDSLLKSWLEQSDGYCFSSYNSYSTPVEVESITSDDQDSITIIINLSSSNFKGWSHLSPDGSDIYVTTAKGGPLYYWVEYINKTAEKAVILVNVTNLPGYSRKTIYLHYGGTNPYPSYRDPDKVYLFYDDFNYSSLSDMVSRGDWQVVNSSAVMNVSNSNVYIRTGGDIYAVRTTERFNEPLTIDYSMWACKNNSRDWDAGIGIGPSESNSVMFVDDMNVPGGNSTGGYLPNYMAIAPYRWSPVSSVDQLPDTDARRDNNWLIPHVYRVDVNSDLNVWFNDTVDGRWNYNESLDNFNSNALPGYIWLINDGDDDDNCAIYGWVAVLPYSVSSQEIYRVHVMEDAEPLIVEYMENATSTGWNRNPVYASGYNTHSIGLVTDLLDLTVDNNVSPGNLSHINVFTSQPAGARTACILRTVNPYYLNPSSISPLIVFLEHEIRMNARN